MPDSLLEDALAFQGRLATFDVGAYAATDCARLVDALSVLEKSCAAVRLLAAARAVEAGVHKNHGFNDGADWMARQIGASTGQARQAFQTARELEKCPDTKAALLAGELSLQQAGEITQTEVDHPWAEAALLPIARQGDLFRLREEARDHRSSHTDPEEVRRRQLAAREFRSWQDRDGLIRFRGALPPDRGLPLVRRIETEALRLRQAARVEGRAPEPFQAYAADALSQLLGTPPGSIDRSRRTDLVVVCDLYAYRRGHAHVGEPCHIIEGGPIPVDVAKELTKDALLKVVLHDGTDIRTIHHFGRHLPAPLRTALDLGPVPEFTGRRWARCGSRWNLEYDHLDPLAHHGPTSYDNLQALCYHDHLLKTEEDRRAGLLGSHPPRGPSRVSSR
jgi:hypothetical protein